MGSARPFIRLVRAVARTATPCLWCPWVIAPLSPVYEPTIGGIAIGRYCNADHAERATPGRMEVHYQ